MRAALPAPAEHRLHGRGAGLLRSAPILCAASEAELRREREAELSACLRDSLSLEPHDSSRGCGLSLDWTSVLAERAATARLRIESLGIRRTSGRGGKLGSGHSVPPHSTAGVGGNASQLLEMELHRSCLQPWMPRRTPDSPASDCAGAAAAAAQEAALAAAASAEASERAAASAAAAAAAREAPPVEHQRREEVRTAPRRRSSPRAMEPATAPVAPAQQFYDAVASLICTYARRVLPASTLRRARGLQVPPLGEPSAPLVRCVRFCVPCDASGVALQPEPISHMELWCDLSTWGRVHVGTVPVPHDSHYRCAFPRIAEAVLHCVPAGAAPPTGVCAEGRAAVPLRTAADHAAARHVISLRLEDEPIIVDAVEVRLLRTKQRGASSAAGAATRRYFR